MRGVWRRISWRWGLALFLLAIPLGLGWAYYFVDGPPVDDSDLVLDAGPIPPEENGWTVLAGKMGQLHRPENDDFGRALNMLGSGIFDREIARKILERYAEALEALDLSRSLPKLRVIADPLDVPLDSKNLWKLSFIACVRVRSLEDQGNHRLAVAEAAELLKMAAKGRASALHPVEHSWWRMFEDQGAQELSRLLLKNRGVFPVLPELGRQVLAGANQPEGLRRMVLGWYVLFDKALEEGSLAELGLDIPSIWRAKLFLLPNQTHSLFVDAARSIIENASRPVKDRQPAILPSYRIESLDGWLRWLPVRNGVGRSLALGWIQFQDSEIQLASRSQVRRIMLGTWIAVGGHRSEHGFLPASLAELIPSRLDEVPLDPYDGEPIRYSAEKGIIWSVGSDFIDGGGSSAQSWQDALQHDAEPTLRIDG